MAARPTNSFAIMASGVSSRWSTLSLEPRLVDWISEFAGRRGDEGLTRAPAQRTQKALHGIVFGPLRGDLEEEEQSQNNHGLNGGRSLALQN